MSSINNLDFAYRIEFQLAEIYDRLYDKTQQIENFSMSPA